ncbi:hypothetical protein [Anaerotignum propionicum]|uniref:Uncharacterized protein n=1 Tax=Anaerotignum propionicum DSM 1682 TaxID=991789 RepID=A0A110A747_ANAPI|nr:hypothetical protein [Anaerotignum propionicum]AMJ41690.1 hypothetical protein CPRO_21100 [Anaerotignum propionicum DSM 1682]SHF16896.1 hypothetical protein SAMN02745151_03001 [[Clostridium] propionicum DSM 1682] [Anaerotignum propionicum DSM 1682]
MINLEKLSNPTVIIDLGGQTMECYLPTEKLLRTMMSMGNQSEEKALDVFYLCLQEIFNSNIDGDVYEYETIKKFVTLSLGKSIISQYLEGAQTQLGK